MIDFYKVAKQTKLVFHAVSIKKIKQKWEENKVWGQKKALMKLTNLCKIKI